MKAKARHLHILFHHQNQWKIKHRTFRISVLEWLLTVLQWLKDLVFPFLSAHFETRINPVIVMIVFQDALLHYILLPLLGLSPLYSGRKNVTFERIL